MKPTAITISFRITPSSAGWKEFWKEYPDLGNHDHHDISEGLVREALANWDGQGLTRRVEWTITKEGKD